MAFSEEEIYEFQTYTHVFGSSWFSVVRVWLAQNRHDSVENVVY
jgi:hypothetical protein